MALAPCTDCGYSISNKAAVCPQCGARPAKKKWWPWALLAVVVAIGILAAAGSSPEAQARIHDEQIIDMCWEDHKTKSFEPATSRFVASTCEMLESKYEKKYGRKP
ncbi:MULTISPECIES: hypothetical protein [unclassified Massilia]|uniref:hypothetical protein n=1 Tax=unclassified Massilia TaxID=2609279 RepID=UPI001783CF7F|nr:MULTISPECIES: hypothetical protein [unclassified Massilia]MBD8531525.1 hypothetical protein [Massilia sp. CFBP 13647]MBD8673679.1 hypothetical protein [Massilia sp. CFBP 13721]